MCCTRLNLSYMYIELDNGTGTLAGIASYGGTMMLASASTGTAIASLTGVAATNATMAWFGGGSLAAESGNKLLNLGD